MKHSAKSLVACSVMSWFVACGDDPSSDGAPTAGTSGSGPSRGGDAGADSSSAGSGGDDSSSTGGAGAAGAAGATGTEGGAAGAAEPDCSSILPNNTVGTLGGESLGEAWLVASVGPAAGDPWFLSNELEGRGYEQYRGPGPADPFAFGDAAHDVDFGLLLAPDESALAGQVVCFEEATVTRLPLALELRTETAKLLGACPGEPVDGEITLCAEGALECDQPVTGEIDGVALDGSGLQLWSSGDAPNTSLQGRGEHLAVVSYVEGDPPSMQTGAVEHALVFVYPSDGEPGVVYCAGADSTYEWQTVNGTRLSLTNLSRLGDCGGGSDELLLCR